MPQNQIIPWATGAGANALAAGALTSQGVVAQGFQSGVASSQITNTILRQVSVIASALGQFTANNQTSDVLDDGVVSNFVSKFTAALQGALASETVHYGVATGTNDALVVTATPPLVPTGTETYQPGSFLIFKTVNGTANQTTAPTINANSIGNIAITKRNGSALSVGDIPSNSWMVVFFDGVGCYLVTLAISDYPAPPAQITYGVTSNLFLAKDGGNNFGVSFANGQADNRSQPVGADQLILRRASDGALVTVLDSALAAYVLSTIVAAQTFKQRLASNLNLYVRSDGNDSNKGLANTSAGAFQTIQGCWNAIFNNYDPSGYTITINVGVGVPGTYAPILFTGYSGSVVLAGDPSNPTGTIINCGGAAQSPVNVPIGGPNLTIQNLILQYDYSGTESPVEATLDITGNSVTIGAGVDFRCTVNRVNLYEIVVGGAGAQVIFTDGVTVTVDGAGSRHSFITSSSGGNVQVATAGGTVYFKSLTTIAYTTFTTANAVSTQTWYQANFSQFTGTGNQASATGPCAIAHGSVVFPGTASTMTTANGGQIY